MTKVKASLGVSKDGFRHPKNGSVNKNKNKNKKFKNTPLGKVALINSSQAKSNGKQASRKNGGGGDVRESPESKKSPKANGKNKGSPKKLSNPKTENEDDDDSDDDINEGITINEEVSGQEDEIDDDDSSVDDDDAVPNIFGTSLADETDDSDEEFEADGDETNADNPENKGIKMFKGVNKVKKQAKKSDDKEEDEDDDDDDDDKEDDEESALGLSALLGDSIKDESDDEDFISMENSDDDDDDEDESDDEIVNQSLNSSNITSTDNDDDDDDDDENEDDDDDDDDEDDEDESLPDTAAILGDSLVDDSDDDDFEADKDEDISDDDDDEEEEEEENEVSGSLKKLKTESSDDSEKNESYNSAVSDTEKNEKSDIITKEEKAERDNRTVFVGNVPKEMTAERLAKEFKKFGPIDALRIRGIIPENPKVPLKVAAITKKYHPKSTTICAFIVFKNEESVDKALSMNGKKLDGNYLRVDRSVRKKKDEMDKKKSLFLGNLPFTVQDNQVWDAFKDCGRIESVRIIRDRNSGLGRGFGYINFETADGAALAMELNGTTICDRQLRVKVIVPESKKKQGTQRKSKKRQLSGDNDGASPKKIKTDNSESVERATRNSLNAEKRKKKGGKKRSQGEKQRVQGDSTSPSRGNKSQEKFQGQTADKKKKPKQDKSLKKKKQMAAKLLAKPKKPSAN